MRGTQLERERRVNIYSASAAFLAFDPRGFFAGLGFGSLCAANRAETRARTDCERTRSSAFIGTELTTEKRMIVTKCECHQPTSRTVARRDSERGPIVVVMSISHACPRPAFITPFGCPVGSSESAVVTNDKMPRKTNKKERG